MEGKKLGEEVVLELRSASEELTSSFRKSLEALGELEEGHSGILAFQVLTSTDPQASMTSVSLCSSPIPAPELQAEYFKEAVLELKDWVEFFIRGINEANELTDIYPPTFLFSYKWQFEAVPREQAENRIAEIQEEWNTPDITGLSEEDAKKVSSQMALLLSD